MVQDGCCHKSLFWFMLICVRKGFSWRHIFFSHFHWLYLIFPWEVRSMKDHTWHFEEGTVTHARPLLEAGCFQAELLQYTRRSTQKLCTSQELLLRSWMCKEQNREHDWWWSLACFVFLFYAKPFSASLKKKKQQQLSQLPWVCNLKLRGCHPVWKPSGSYSSVAFVFFLNLFGLGK